MELATSKKLLKISEAAEQLAVRESTLRAWILSRRITLVRVGRRAIRIPAAEIARIIEQGTIPAREERQ